MKMIIDVSSVLWQSLLAGKDEEFGRKVRFDGRDVHVNGWQFGYECAVAHLTKVMRETQIGPRDMIFVVEGAMSKALRRAIYPEYKMRADRPEEAYVQFGILRDKLKTTFLDLGAQVVWQDGVESDDVIAFLCRNMKEEVVIVSRDGDLAALCDGRVSYHRNGALLVDNPYGPFPFEHITVYKALVGDGDEYKGAKGFGETAFLNMLVWADNIPGVLAALHGMMERRILHELEDDVADFKPFRKVIDGAKHVYESFDCALLHSEWVNTPRQPLRLEVGQAKGRDAIEDDRLRGYASLPDTAVPPCAWWNAMFPPKVKVQKNHCVFDVELIGSEDPVFLVCTKIIETGERASFWFHKDGDMARLHEMLQREDLTWVSFNGIHFDAPLISAAIEGKDPKILKIMANALIIDGAKSWQLPSQFGYSPVIFDHIDLIDVSPGVKISLKTFAGRMGYPTMVDLPFHHDQDLSAEECVILESYCQNDLGVTEELFKRLKTEIELRAEMSEEHGIDLRSKSDAQVAEAILKKVVGIKSRDGHTPPYVQYKAPAFIQTDSDVINELIYRLEDAFFTINQGNGAVQAPAFLEDPIELGTGTYQCGVGGLHSTHDKRLHVVATDELLISDFDVASYYPNIMLKAGLTPRLEGGKGQAFIDEYRNIYDRRMEAKRSGNKRVANALKISLNGTFGKLGSQFSAFYSPDLMLAVTLTGQLNLMCLIYDLECRPSIKILSANTDGIMVQYRPQDRERVLQIIHDNAQRTGFEYEETRYAKVAMKDVNNYNAITTDDEAAVIHPTEGIKLAKGKGGVAKRKGLYASNDPKENPLYLMKNPTMGVCANMAVDYLREGVLPTEALARYTDMKDFVSIRNVKGGGIQYDMITEIDDWVLVKELDSKDNEWARQAWIDAGLDRVVKRKSRPKPVEVGIGGVPFGRLARWYMSNQPARPINYVGSGNKVPKTEGARLCMTLPTELPEDLDTGWYIRETLSMLADMGVVVPGFEQVGAREETDEVETV